MAGQPSAPLPLSPAALREIDTCVHCGLCLPACPTYRELGQEADSPRGRIYLVKAAHEGRVGVDSPTLHEHLDLCLGCLACESACPSGVGYRHILEEARAGMEPVRRRPWPVRWLRQWLLRRVVPHPRRLRRLAWLAGWARRLGLHRLGAALRLAPAHLAGLAEVTPFPGRPARGRLPAAWPEPAGATGQPRSAVFLGCVQDVLFPETNMATARLLERHGCAVAAPAQQSCCGALHAHAGDAETARQLARRNIDAFAAAQPDYVVVNAAGCGAHLKQYGHLLHDDPVYARRAAEFAARVRELTELLGERTAASPGTGTAAGPASGSDRPALVTYQDPCHLAHGQRIRRQPRELLGRLPDLALVELGSDSCCGSAGFYNLAEPEMSMQVLDRKMAQIKASGAAVVVTANPGCLLQLRLGARRAGLDLEVIHIADLLDREGAAT